MARTVRTWAGVVVAAALVVGCESVAERSILPAPPDSLTILFGADNQGVLSSCGCPTNPSGGFAKRQTIIDKFRRVRSDVVMVDAGDMFPERPNDLKVKYLATALGRAAYDAVAMGDQEFTMGVAKLQALAAEHKIPLICANVRDASGELVFPPHVIREAAGHRIGIFAVIADDPLASGARDWREGLKVEPPQEAAKREVADLKDCDLIIALSHQPIEATNDLAKNVPGIHLVVSGHDPAIFRKPVEVGTTKVLAVGPVGRVVGALTFSPGPDGAPVTTMNLVGLSEKTVRDSPWVLDLYWAYVKKAKGEAPPEWALTPPPPNYEPASACAKCHEKAFKQWETTGHAHAYATIKAKKRHEDPECILCHTMGYGRANGFYSIEETPGLGAVTCQACHPVTSKHGDEKAPKIEAKFLPKTFINARLCISCHGLVESPDFDFYAYRAKISHGSHGGHGAEAK